MQITPGLHSLGDTSGGRVRAFLIHDGNGLTLIDTLLNKDGRDILDQIRLLGRQPKDLKRIILTHAHQSHLGGLAALKKASGATVYSHDWEADIIAGKRKVTGSSHHRLLAAKAPPGLRVASRIRSGARDARAVRGGPKPERRRPCRTTHGSARARTYPGKHGLLLVGQESADCRRYCCHLARAGARMAADYTRQQAKSGIRREAVRQDHAEILCVAHGEPIVRAGARVMKDLFEGRSTQPEFAKAAVQLGKPRPTNSQALLLAASAAKA